MHTSVGQLQQVSMRMKNIADRRYTWPVIAAKYLFMIRKVQLLPAKNKLYHRAGLDLAPHVLLGQQLGHLQAPLLFYEKR
jgi:hypothetical protein